MSTLSDIFELAEKTDPEETSADILKDDILSYCDPSHIIEAEGEWLDAKGLQTLLQRPRNRALLSRRLQMSKRLIPIDMETDLKGVDLELVTLPYETVWEACLDVSTHWHIGDIQNAIDGQSLRDCVDVIGEERLNYTYYNESPDIPTDIHINHEEQSLAEGLMETAQICLTLWLTHMPESIRQRVLLKYPAGVESIPICSEDIHFLSLLKDNIQTNYLDKSENDNYATTREKNTESRSQRTA